jgi:hypothetical protein
MAMKLQVRTLMFVASVAMATAWGHAGAAEIPVVTGEHWTTSSEVAKKAYLVGIANLLQIETAYHAENPPTDAQKG